MIKFVRDQQQAVVFAEANVFFTNKLTTMI